MYPLNELPIYLRRLLLMMHTTRRTFENGNLQSKCIADRAEMENKTCLTLKHTRRVIKGVSRGRRKRNFPAAPPPTWKCMFWLHSMLDALPELLQCAFHACFTSLSELLINSPRYKLSANCIVWGCYRSNSRSIGCLEPVLFEAFRVGWRLLDMFFYWNFFFIIMKLLFFI